MKIYTGIGDDGKTRGLDGSVLDKFDPAIRLEGDIDELCAHLGLVKATIGGADADFIEVVQKNICKIMAHVSDRANDEYAVTGDDVTVLEREIDRLAPNVPKGFQLPGRSVLDARIHIARAVARRVERGFFAMRERHPLCPAAGAYLNRLSDYLFALTARESVPSPGIIKKISLPK